MGFCERLTALLKEKKIDKNDFLSDCGLGRNSFSNWKTSKKGYPTAPVLKVISDYLGVSTEYLMGETDERGQKISPMSSYDTGDEVEHYFALLTPENQAYVKSVIAERLKEQLQGL